MIQVLHIIANNSSVPYFSWLAKQSKHQQELKLSFAALHSERPAMLDEMKGLGLDCYWVPFSQAKRGSSMMKAVPALWKLFRSVKPDVIHCHLFDDSVPALIAARLAGIKVRVITKQDTGFHWHYAPKALKFDRLNNRNATHIVAVSGECRDFVLEKERADPKKVFLVNHGIPLEELSAQSDNTKTVLKQRYALDGRLVIGTVARYIDWKGYKHILEAAPKVVEQYPEAIFVFAGSGPQEDELRSIVKEKGLENHVVFTGWLKRDEIPSLYGVMDIYLHAASLEPFGFVIAEAMANGLPMISTPTGAAADGIIHKENGYLLAGKDLAIEIPEAVSWLMQNDRKKMGEQAKKASEKFAFINMWNGYSELYRKALKLPSSGA